MVRTSTWMIPVALLLSACAGPRAESSAPPAPAYVPANAAPPLLSNVSNDLTGATWLWERTQRVDNRIVTADTPDRFTLSFEAGGRVNLRADCNRGAGPYAINGATMSMGPFATTKMLCGPASKDTEFLRDLGMVSGFTIERGKLELALRSGGAIRFTRVP